MIELPWPSSDLSGHANGSWYLKQAAVKKHRKWAHDATLAALPAVPAFGDIHINVRFVPPDRRSDRVNFPNRMKPYFDGIADALGVNDVRFLPTFEFCQPEKPGRVEITVGSPVDNATFPCCSAGNMPQIERAETAASTAASPNHETCSGGQHGC